MQLYYKHINLGHYPSSIHYWCYNHKSNEIIYQPKRFEKQRGWLNAGIKEEKQRHRRREISSHTAVDMWSAIQLESRRSPLCVWGHFAKWALMHFMLALRSSVNCQLSGRPGLRRTRDCRYSQQMWEESCWVWVHLDSKQWRPFISGNQSFSVHRELPSVNKIF